MIWLLASVRASLEAVLGSAYPITLEVPAGKAAWLAIPVFAEAKRLGVSPQEQAKAVAATLEAVSDVVVEVEGGFVNVRPAPGAYLRVLAEAQLPTYGQSASGSGQTVVIEFSSVNIAKPMGIGHLRSTIIGDALQRLYRALGYTVVAVNHLGDWGTQFGNLVAAYQRHYGDLTPRPELTVNDLLSLYVDFHANVTEDPTLKAEGQAMFRRLEAGDEAVRVLWQHFVELSLTTFETMYDRFGITFDDVWAGESRYQTMVPALIEQAERAGVAVESERALVIHIPDESAPLILRKTDGSTIYATRDLAAIQYRIREYQPNRIVYVVANEQALHFRQVFAAARLLDLLPVDTELIHVKFGLVRTAEGKMSTRKGTVIALDTLLDEAVARATAMLADRAQELSEHERQQTVETLAIGALKYFDLSHDRKHDIVFDWERMLSIKGDSAPYLQYSYVRANNILLKAADKQDHLIVEEDPALLAVVEEYGDILRMLAQYPIVLEQSATQYAPHLLAQYLNQLASQFHGFYERYPVLSSEGAERVIRLAIVRSFRQVLKAGLSMLGIQVVEVM